MDFGFTPEQDAWRAEVREFCRRHVVEAGRNALNVSERHDPAFYRLLAERGYIGMQWPREYGGQGRSHVDMAIFYEEMAYANAPFGRYTGSVVFVGESICHYGSPEQRAAHLPRIARGEVTCCWCLSEPDAGSDAASLKTRAAERPGGGWRLSGQKIFTSGAHIADLAMVAARTNPDAPQHLGISVFLVPMRTPGVRVRPLPTIGGWHVNQVFFDDVDLPAGSLMGERDGGWARIRQTLSFERSAIAKAGLLMRMFDRILAHAADEPLPAALWERLCDARAEIEALRWLSYRVAWLQDRGEAPEALASMGKLRASELTVTLAELGMEALGEHGAERGAGAPLGGEMEHLYRNGPFFVAGGGTSDIQRIVIATRGLGLPRR